MNSQRAGKYLPGMLVRSLGYAVSVAAFICAGCAGAEESAALKDRGRTEISDKAWSPPPPDPVVRPKVVYGADDRRDVYQETDPVRIQQAKSVCGLVNSTALTNNGNGTYTLALSTYEFGGRPACASEPFASQPTAPWCTGFLVGEDLIATAGHCFDSGDIGSVRFVFGFQMQNSSTPISTFSADQVYTGVALAGFQHIGDLDYSIVRVDRRVTAPGAVPLQVRRTGLVPLTTKVGVIGHPWGLPLKIAFGNNTTVQENTNSGYLLTNLDTFGGNSGSPVFNQATGEVEGILVFGETDFVVGPTCFTSNQMADAAGGEGVTKAVQFQKFIPGISFDQKVMAPGVSASVFVVDDNLAPLSLQLQVASSSGDLETLTATDPDNDNTYAANFSLGSTGQAAVPGNGVLEVTCGDTLTATYADANAGANTPRNFTNTATVDCTPPTGTFTLQSVGIAEAAIQIVTNTPTIARVEATSNCSTVVTSATSSLLASNYSVQLSNLQSCSKYKVRVAVTDEKGMGVYLNGGACIDVQTSGATVLFSDTFDPAAASGWAHSAASGVDNWLVRTSPFAATPPNVYGMVPGGSVSGDSRLVSPALPAAETLEFQHSYEFEKTTSAWDGGVLEFTTNGGNTWTDMGSRIVDGGYNGTLSSSTAGLPSRQAWVGGTLGTMSSVRVNVTGIAAPYQVRFRFGSDLSVASGGWVIDNFRVYNAHSCVTAADADWMLAE